MRALVVEQGGGRGRVRCVRRPIPEPGPAEVVLRVAASGVNRADLMQRDGAYPLRAGWTDVLGLEAGGTVVAVGDDVPTELLGTSRCALLPGGGHAEFVGVRASHTLPVPAGIDPVDAAGLPEAAATVWSNVFALGAPEAGRWLLVHGGASGIGAMAIQLAVAHGIRVATTVGTAEKARFAQALGAEITVVHGEADFVEVLASHDVRPQVILDILGGDQLNRNLAVLARGGRVAVIGHLAGTPAPLDLDLLLRSQLTLTGTALRSRPDREKDQIIAELQNRVWPHLAAGRITPTTDARLRLDRADEALELLDSRAVRGKVLLIP